MTTANEFLTAWHELHSGPPRDPVAIARRRNAARVVADVADRELPRVLAVRITEHFDWERCRVNMYALVSPKLVRCG